jgi:hypothetical protein
MQLTLSDLHDTLLQSIALYLNGAEAYGFLNCCRYLRFCLDQPRFWLALNTEHYAPWRLPFDSARAAESYR